MKNTRRAVNRHKQYVRGARGSPEQLGINVIRSGRYTDSFLGVSCGRFQRSRKYHEHLILSVYINACLK